MTRQDLILAAASLALRRGDQGLEEARARLTERLDAIRPNVALRLEGTGWTLDDVRREMDARLGQMR